MRGRQAGSREKFRYHFDFFFFLQQRLEWEFRFVLDGRVGLGMEDVVDEVMHVMWED